jgi:hypothetical protein
MFIEISEIQKLWCCIIQNSEVNKSCPSEWNFQNISINEYFVVGLGIPKVPGAKIPML